MHLASPIPSRVEQIAWLAALSIRSEREDDVHTLSLTGEIDLANVAEVEQELSRIEATDAEVILVDLAGVSFIDSTGIRALIAAAARSQADHRLVLTRPTPAVLRVLRIAGVADRLPLLA